jgi:hypothetical protein
LFTKLKKQNMKKTLASIFGVWALVMLATASFGQTNSGQSNSKPTYQNPTTLSDPTMSSRLQTDLSGRNSQLGNNSVSWYDTGNGYYGTYSIGNENYMARYDKQGKYIDTMTKGNWNDSDVPQSLKSAYDKSNYKNQRVTGYWSLSDPSSRKGYYLETQDNNGKTSRIWADENGKFSTSPPSNYNNERARSK